jgi:hypothetical protein
MSSLAYKVECLTLGQLLDILALAILSIINFGVLTRANLPKSDLLFYHMQDFL